MGASSNRTRSCLLPVLVCTGQQNIVMSCVVGASSTLPFLPGQEGKIYGLCCRCSSRPLQHRPVPVRACTGRQDNYMSCVVGAVPYFVSIDPYPFLLAQEGSCVVGASSTRTRSCLHRQARNSYELCSGRSSIPRQRRPLPVLTYSGR